MINQKLKSRELESYAYPIDTYQYFVGKVCSIFTTKPNLTLDTKTWTEYFVGRVHSIDEYGIWYTNLITNAKSYCFMQMVISINEEIVADKDDPRIKNSPAIQKAMKSKIKDPDPNDQLTILNEGGSCSTGKCGSS